MFNDGTGNYMHSTHWCSMSNCQDIIMGIQTIDNHSTEQFYSSHTLIFYNYILSDSPYLYMTQKWLIFIFSQDNRTIYWLLTIFPQMKYCHPTSHGVDGAQLPVLAWGILLYFTMSPWYKALIKKAIYLIHWLTKMSNALIPVTNKYGVKNALLQTWWFKLCVARL